jgi:ribonuclease D
MIADQVTIETGDVSEEFLERTSQAERVAWDIETTGLDWRSSLIGTCQLATSAEIVIVQLRPAVVPARLCKLLAADDVEKVFHHAPFDLRFMAQAWGVRSSRVSCTKILSKILDPHMPHEAHSLQPVLKRYMGIEINKDEQQSDWSALALRPEQIAYAATDVRHLLPLFDAMNTRARELGVWELARDSFKYLPTRVALDIRGAEDVYTY